MEIDQIREELTEILRASEKAASRAEAARIAAVSARIEASDKGNFLIIVLLIAILLLL